MQFKLLNFLSAKITFRLVEKTFLFAFYHIHPKVDAIYDFRKVFRQVQFVTIISHQGRGSWEVRAEEEAYEDAE